MKKNTLSKCSLAISIAIGLGILSNSAFAVNNNINPLTGSPEPAVTAPVSTATPVVNNGIQPTSTSQQNLTDNSSSGNSDSISDSKAKNDSNNNSDDYSYENEEANLKKASNLRVELTLLDLENQVKTQKDTLKGIKPAQGSNGVSVNQTNGQQSPVQEQNTPTYKDVEVKTPTMKATAVYGLGGDMTAEIYIGDNKYVMSVGSILPNGFKVVNASIYGVTLRKGSQKVILPIVPIPQVGSNVNVTTQKQLINQNINGMSPNGMGFNGTNPPQQ